MLKVAVTVKRNDLPGLAARVRAGAAAGFERSRGPAEDAVREVTPRRGGFLQESVASAADEDGLVVGAGGGPVDYAPHVQFGTRRQRAQPFLDVGVQNAAPAIARAVADAIADGVGR